MYPSSSESLPSFAASLQVFVVLFHIYKHRSLQEFWSIVSSRALARNLFVKFCKARVRGV